MRSWWFCVCCICIVPDVCDRMVERGRCRVWRWFDGEVVCGGKAVVEKDWKVERFIAKIQTEVELSCDSKAAVIRLVWVT